MDKKINIDIFDDFLEKCDNIFENISFSKEWHNNLEYDKILNKHKSHFKIGIRHIETIQDNNDFENITVYCNTYKIDSESAETEFNRIIERTISSKNEIRRFGLDNDGKSYFEYVQYDELRQNQNSIACLCMGERFEYRWMGEVKIEDTFSMSHNDNFRSNIDDTKNILWINGKPCYKHDYVVKTNVFNSISIIVMKSSQFASFYVPLHKSIEIFKKMDELYNEGKNMKNMGEQNDGLPAGFISYPSGGRIGVNPSNLKSSGGEFVIQKEVKSADLMDCFLSKNTLHKLRLKKDLDSI